MEEVMIFVNTIASIVHSNADKYGGAPNKNIGDAFLLVWKLIINFEDESMQSLEITDENEYIVLKKIQDDPLNKTVTELAVIAFIDMIYQIETMENISYFNQHPKLNNKMPNY